MKLRIDERIYEGSGTEILEQMQSRYFDPGECPSIECYLWQLRNNFVRATGLECILPNSGLERQARALFAQLAKAGALEVLDDG